MPSLSSRDYQSILRLAAELVGDLPPGRPWQLVCETLMAALSAPIAGVFEAVAGTEAPGEARPPWTRRPTSRPPPPVHRHPFVLHRARCDNSVPRSASHPVAPSEWTGSVWQEALTRDFRGADRLLAIPLDAPPDTIRAVVVGRPGVDFSRRDRAYARCLQSLIVGLDRRLPTFTGLDPGRGGTAAGLTPRELAVLELLAQGHTAVAIGRRLAVTPHTVSKHQQNIYRKLGTNDRLTTVLRAQTLRLLSANPA